MAKRIATSSVNWGLLSESVNTQLDAAAYQAFKSKTDRLLRNIASNPAEMPKIDWAFYKSRIAKPGMVDSFQKSLETLKIPYPTDQGYLAKIDQQLAKAKQDYKAAVENVHKEVAEWEVKLQKLKEQLPYSEMCIEEYYVACPANAIDHDKPTIRLPHKE